MKNGHLEMLERKSLRELMQLQKEIADAIEIREQRSAGAQRRQRIQARRQLETRAKDLGFSLVELVRGDAKLRRRRRSTIHNDALNAQTTDDP